MNTPQWRAYLEHEPAGPLVLSAFVGAGYLLVRPVLIALALFGANRALGNVRTALICVAGQVIGTAVSEGIVAYRVDAGQLPGGTRRTGTRRTGRRGTRRPRETETQRLHLRPGQLTAVLAT
jgi:hypothetical protein